MAESPNALADVKALMGHEAFDRSNPNTYRALVNTFATANPAAFHKKDGSGYKFVADQVIEVDARNPKVAARLATSFGAWRRHDKGRQRLIKRQLKRIEAKAKSK